MELNADYPSLDLVYSETRDRVIRQVSTIEHVNIKTSIIVGTDAVLLVAILGVLTSVGPMAEDVAAIWQLWIIPTLASITSFLTLGSLVFSAIAFRPVTYKEVPNPRGAHDELICLPPDESKLQLLHTMIDSFEDTRETLGKNLTYFKVSLWLMVAAMGLATITTGLYVYGIIRGYYG